MIEAAIALWFWSQQPTSLHLQEARRVRIYKRKPVPKPKPAPERPARIELIQARVDNPAFEQTWQYRVCIYEANWISDDTLQCTW